MSTATPRPTDVTVGRVMTAPVLTCGPESPIREVARIMAEARVHAVIVCGIEGEAWSAISARDLMLVPAIEAFTRRARDVAATEVVTVSIDAPLDAAARLLAEHDVEHAVVVDAGHRPVGIVSSLDLVGRLAA